VDGATHVALSLSVSEAVVGASMVAIGTSLPEVSTTVIAAFHRSAGVAFGNVIGSNVFNILAIIGATALVTPIPVDAALLGYDGWVMLAAAVALTAIVLRDVTLRRPAGIGMLVVYTGYIGSLYWPA
jgi:cation:H+ antiporter